jgi:type IV secretion system protein VirB8
MAGAKVAVRVESVSPLGDARGQDGRALVRFVSTVQDARGNGGGAAGQAAYWVAVLQYRFVGNPASLEDRLTNPLGFQVVAYRRDQEAPPVAAPVAAAAQPALTPMNAAMAPAAAAQPLTLPRARWRPMREPTPRPNLRRRRRRTAYLALCAMAHSATRRRRAAPAAGQATSQITGGEP